MNSFFTKSKLLLHTFYNHTYHIVIYDLGSNRYIICLTLVIYVREIVLSVLIELSIKCELLLVEISSEQ